MSARKVLIVAPKIPPSGGMALQAALLQRLLEEDGVPVSFLASNSDFPAMLAWCGRLPAFQTVVRSVLVWMKFWRAVRDTDVVHVFAASWLYFFLIVAPSILVGRLRGKRTVLNYRGGDARPFFRRWGSLLKPVFRMASVVTTPSEFLAQLIRGSFGVPVTVVPNILDTSAFQFQHRRAFRPHLLVNRNLDKIYGVESVLRAFRLLLQRYPEASLWIAGSGSEEPRLRRLAVDWNLTGVRFLGHVDHADLPAICSQRDILVNASTVDNFPAALLEASAAGLVVVSTEAGGIPYIYRNEASALLVPVGDSQGLATAVERVIRNPLLAGGLAKEAYGLTRQCTWGMLRDRLYACYASVDDGSLRSMVARRR
jgi:glycosyltransferase involved in cell wall biosynthesis